MAKGNTRLDVIWFGKENRPELGPRVLNGHPETPRRRTNIRRKLFNVQDAIDARREDLIGKVEETLK